MVSFYRELMMVESLYILTIGRKAQQHSVHGEALRVLEPGHPGPDPDKCGCRWIVCHSRRLEPGLAPCREPMVSLNRDLHAFNHMTMIRTGEITVFLVGFPTD